MVLLTGFLSELYCALEILVGIIVMDRYKQYSVDGEYTNNRHSVHLGGSSILDDTVVVRRRNRSKTNDLAEKIDRRHSTGVGIECCFIL